MQFFGILCIMLLASVAEVFSLGMVVPFLAVLVDPSGVESIPLLGGLITSSTAPTLVVWLGAAFCAATLLSAVTRLLMLYATTKFILMLGADLSHDVYRRALYQPYSVHIARNSAEVINGVSAKASAVATNVLGQLLTIASSSLLSLGVLAALLAVNVTITLAAVGGFMAVYAVILWATRRSIAHQSMVVAREGPRTYKALQEGLGGIRDVIIDGTQEAFVDAYRVSDRRLRVAQARILVSAGSPRFLVESLGMILIVVIAIMATANGANANVIATLGALGLGAQRLLPVIQQAYAAVVTIRGSEAMLDDVLDILEQPLPMATAASSSDVRFDQCIQFSNVDFSYESEDVPVLRGVDLTIPRGSRVGVFGPTGGGKSTFLDIVMGLLHPTQGTMLVDGIAVTAANRASWQRHVAHVPQAIFLTDATIAENIAFGRPVDQIDMGRVRRAADVAQISTVINGLPKVYDTLVGERGERLSGGQRQRIGIARALYKDAELIILDEATSALDSQTEADLMAAIEGLSDDLTIIMVAHRMSTLRGCNILLEVVGGRVRRVESADVFGH